MKSANTILRLISLLGVLSVNTLSCIVDRYVAQPNDELLWDRSGSMLPDTGKIQCLTTPKTKWTLSSTDGIFVDVPAFVPGDVLSDLLRAKLIGDPYFGRNFWTQREIWMGKPNALHNNTDGYHQQRTRIWVYATDVVLDEDSFRNKSVVLIVEGIKMGATFFWNGGVLGNATNQFSRYSWTIPRDLIQLGLESSTETTVHKLTVAFDPSIPTNGRYMACSGGWDWSLYSRATDERGSRVFSFGIVKPMYVAAIESAAISSVLPQVFYKGAYSRTPLHNGPESDFDIYLNVTIRYEAESVTPLYLLVEADFMNGTLRQPLNGYTQGTAIVSQTVTLQASKDTVQLWWPNGLGEQPLYTVRVSLQSYHDDPIKWMTSRIGFRTVALVTNNETDDTTLQRMQDGQDGSGHHGMYFRVNGALVYSRGANMVPMDQLEGRWTNLGHRELVQSVADAGMNMLRVWGGGAVLPDSFYDACDELGILLYHDLMFVGEQKHGATVTEGVEREIEITIQRLAEHPSIVLWSGCNECTYDGGNMDVYQNFVLAAVANLDKSRAIWPSSPSDYGWESGVRTIDGRPNGKPLCIRNTTGKSALETHGPYHRGFSPTHSGVNGMLTNNTFESKLPPVFSFEGATGPAHPNVFVSEFGSSAFSSFESMSALLPVHAWSLHGGELPDICEPAIGDESRCYGENAMAERNYPCDNKIQIYFGNVSLDDVGSEAFQKQLYMCMISQTLWLKSEIETQRSKNSLGTLIWQLNENWPTGGWGLLEYGSGKGLPLQIAGGRWKPVFFILRDALYRDVLAACGSEGNCYVQNYGLYGVNVVVNVEAWNFALRKPIRSSRWETYLEGNAAQTQRFSLNSELLRDAEVAIVRVTDKRDGRVLMKESAYLWQVPHNLSGLLLQTRIGLKILESSPHRVLMQLQTNRLALYVVLSSAVDGRFTDNSFHLSPLLPKTVEFKAVQPNDPVDVEHFLGSMRIEHLGTYFSAKYETSVL